MSDIWLNWNMIAYLNMTMASSFKIPLLNSQRHCKYGRQLNRLFFMDLWLHSLRLESEMSERCYYEDVQMFQSKQLIISLGPFPISCTCRHVKKENAKGNVSTSKCNAVYNNWLRFQENVLLVWLPLVVLLAIKAEMSETSHIARQWLLTMWNKYSYIMYINLD